MKREELQKLGLSDEQVDSVMAMHGTDIQSLKGQVSTLETERDNYKTQVDEASSTIATLKKDNKDIEDIQKAAKEWEDKFNQAEKDRVNAVNDAKLNAGLAGVQANDINILKSQLNLDALSFTDEGIQGLDEQIKTLKEQKAFLFKPETPGDMRFERHKPPKSDGDTISSLEQEINAVFGE